MDQIVVKLEDQNNGEILLYYVDENGDHQEGVLTTIENIENSSIQIQDNSYILGNLEDIVEEESLQTIEALNVPPSIEWTDEDIKRLLIFYNDNKTAFISGATQKKHLWTVACKTMLIGKNQEACESKLEELKKKYCEVRSLVQNRLYANWPYFDICHQTFHDDKSVVAILGKKLTTSNTILNQEPKKDDVVAVRYMNVKTVDQKVVQMLKLYIKYKDKFQKEYWRRDLWDTIAKEMGETDGEYLQKRFLNYKQHYLQMLERKMESNSPISWPYMSLFDEIFKDDAAFHKKYFNSAPESIQKTAPEDNENIWDNTQITVLAKYYIESYDEFQDPTIPKKFLWTEIGRLIEKSPDTCKAKFFEMREQHLQKYIQGAYNIQKRMPVEIIYDHIISKDVKKQLDSEPGTAHPWKTAQTDELVQFFYSNLQLFKDPICHYVCWAAVGTKLKRNIESCKRQWTELTTLYKSLLDSKKDNPKVEIDWRYIEMFDGIFNYGMDAKFLKGFDENVNEKSQIHTETAKVGAKKLKLEQKDDSDKDYTPESDKHNSTEPRTDPKSTKILEYYLKNKDKFQHQKNKVSLWDPLAKEIGMSSTQCSHRFRYLKQSYIEFVEKEMKQPKIAITWPYYLLCKKIFGYRTMKNKIKQGQVNDNDDWMAREIKQLISYFSKNYDEINSNIDDVSKWAPLATELGKSAQNCKEKFVELRKCYRKLKTMKSRNPEVKISWSYFDMFHRIYSLKEPETMEVEALNDDWSGEGMEEDDYQCIIVLPEGQDLTSIENAQFILPKNQDTVSAPGNFQNKWTKRTKKLLLIHYINYIRMHRGKEIVQKDMWNHIASKINKTPANCRKMFLKLKKSFENATETTKQSSPFTKLLEIVLKLKPKFTKIGSDKDKNVELPHDKIRMALNYYLEHIEDFLNPKFEKKYLWNELANHISEPVNKVYKKLNYLKQSFITETGDISGLGNFGGISEKIPEEFSQILKQIIDKENLLNVEKNTVQKYSDFDVWSDEEINQLLHWYLGNLDKFKNPKFDRTYLWVEAASILMKNPVICSKKMTEIRTQYRNMVKQNSNELKNWKFLDLCQKIYGTGKKDFSMAN